MSLHDLALFANEHLQGQTGRSSLLKPETFQRLHEPSLDDYAYGWVVQPRKELNVGTVLWHNGSNTMWYALVAVLPDINTVIAVMSNDGNINLAEQTAWEIIRQLVQSPAISK